MSTSNALKEMNLGQRVSSVELFDVENAAACPGPSQLENISIQEQEESLNDLPNVDLRRLAKERHELLFLRELKVNAEDSISNVSSDCSRKSSKSAMSNQSISSIASLKLKYKTNLADLKVKQKYQKEEEKLIYEFEKLQRRLQCEKENLRIKREIEQNEACLRVVEEEELILSGGAEMPDIANSYEKVPSCVLSRHGEPSSQVYAGPIYTTCNSSSFLRPTTSVAVSPSTIPSTYVDMLNQNSHSQVYTNHPWQSIPVTSYQATKFTPFQPCARSSISQPSACVNSNEFNYPIITQNKFSSREAKVTNDFIPEKVYGASRLPEIKIEVFDGDILKYPSWETAFNGLVEAEVMCVEQKMNFLSQYLIGEPKELVESYLLLQTEEAYYTAKSELKRRYGNSNLISMAFLNKLKEWPNLAPHDPIGLRRFSDFLNQLLAAKSRFHCLGILDCSQENTKIVAKLPYDIIALWRDNVRLFKTEKKNENAYPLFEHLVKFIYDQSENANIPELCDLRRESKMPYFNSRDESKRQKAVVMSTSIVAQSESCCIYCTMNHLFKDCEKFSQLSLEDRRQFVYENELCFSCGSGGHLARNCRNKARCNKCKKRHMTCFHQDILQKISSSRTTANNQMTNE